MTPGSVVDEQRQEAVAQLTSTESSDNRDIEEPRLRAEYAIWKKNAPFLYDMILTTRLSWPSLTVEWLPEVEVVNTTRKSSSTLAPNQANEVASSLSRYKVLLGTQTSGNAYEYVRVGIVDLPNLNTAPKVASSLSLLNKYDSVLGEFGGYQTSRTQFKIHQYLDHTGEVNRSRYLPQNPSMVATGSSNGRVYLFDCTKHPLDPRNSTSLAESLASKSTADSISSINITKSMTISNPRPDMIMEAHTNEVSSLSWNQFRQGQLASGSYDHTVAIWNIKAWSKGKSLSPISIIKTHRDLVNDVEWHKFNPALLGSVSDDGTIHIHDTRVPEVGKIPQLESIPIYSGKQGTESYSKTGINCMSFNVANENLVATGGTDSNVVLWDIRAVSTPLHTMHGHADNVNAVEWSPHEPTILASASSDRRVCIWDVSRIGNDQENQPTTDNKTVLPEAPPPELLWVHGGHTESVSDISWNPALPWVLASVSNDNHIHIFKPAQNLVS